MTELTEEELALVRAGLDADERDAKDAADGAAPDWEPGDENLSHVVRERDGDVVVIGPYEYLDWSVRRHIARHDPARVLRDVGVWRQILTDYEKEARVMEQGHRTGWTEGGQAVRETVLRGLALSYAEPTDA